MKKYLLSDIAHTIRGDVISEEDIYYNYKKGGVPVYSSNTKNNGKIGEVSQAFFNKVNAKGNAGEITWTTDGNAGNFVLRHDIFLFTNVCGKIIIKEKWKNKILAQWLSIYLNFEAKKYVTSKGGNAKLMKEQVDNIEIIILPIEEQKNIINKFIQKEELLLNIKNSAILLKAQIKKEIKSKTKIFLIKELFEVMSGIRITQFDIYNNPGIFPVVTAKTKDNGIAWYGDKLWLESITKNDKKVIIEEECLTWTKDGAKCGTLFYRDYAFYPNDHCGVLLPKIPLNLLWIKQHIQPIIFQHVVAKDAQGMLYEEQMANIQIEIPIKENGEIDLELQNKIYSEYKKVSDIKEKLELLINKYSL